MTSRNSTNRKMNCKTHLTVLGTSLCLSLFIPTSQAELPIGTQLKDFNGASKWLNSPPLTAESLKGKVVAVEFYTSACSNCRAAVPHVVELYGKYKNRGLVVIGVHTPELSIEHNLAFVRKTISELGITYPVAIDDDAKVWTTYQNKCWPNILLFDKKGQLVYEHAGEGAYQDIDALVGKLL